MKNCTLIGGDALTELRRLPSDSVHCCVSSPPYLGLRNYGTAPQVWGGDPTCAHEFDARRYYTEQSAAQGSKEAFSAAGEGNAARLKAARWREDATCVHCGAWRGELGLEGSVEQYVAHLVEVFAEVRRVLHPTGTCWLNLGDSYARSAAKGQHKPGQSGKEGYCYDAGGGRASAHPSLGRGGGGGQSARSTLRGNGHGGDKPLSPYLQALQQQARLPARVDDGLKEKDLIGVPWRVALALQADGWYLRSDIIWAKGNAMPESVTDRPSCSHEYLFLLAKNARYFYDALAIREKAVSTHGSGNGYSRPEQLTRAGRGQSQPWQVTPYKNRRSVWRLNCRPYKGAHFATYPPELVSRCVQAGTSEYGACAACGTPYVRVTAKGEPDREWQRRCGGDAAGQYHGSATKEYGAAGAQDASATKARILAGMAPAVTVGWQKRCRCATEAVKPCTVLDPFLGSGTTAAVALSLGRAAVGIELNPEYLELVRERLAHVQPVLLEADSFRGGTVDGEERVCPGGAPVPGDE